MKIIDKLIPINKYNRPGSKSTPKRICVHYTGQAGTDADRLALFYSNVATGRFPNKPNNWTSTQYIVGLNGKVSVLFPITRQPMPQVAKTPERCISRSAIQRQAENLKQRLCRLCANWYSTL